MSPVFRYGHIRARLLVAWRDRAVSLKAIAFGLVGVVNTLVDYCIFLIARAAFDGSAAALAAFASFAAVCKCGGVEMLSLIAANTIAWIVAVTGSYVMNSFVTFAAETGGKLRWSAYFTFVASGVAGWIANTVILLVLAEVLLLPVFIAKAGAILASFVVNFSLSHFVVFRAQPRGAAKQ
jgi:putative flippase GtrA